MACSRVQWIDVAKGSSILAVVFLHVIVSSLDAGVLTSGGSWDGARYALFSGFLMATFFWIAGMFSESTTPTSIWSGSVYPYLLWGGVFLIAQALTGDMRNDAGTVPTGVALLWTPIAWLWFLWALAVYQLAALVLRPVPMLILVILLLPLTDVIPTQFARQILFFMPMFALARVIGARALSPWWFIPVVGWALLAWLDGQDSFVLVLLPAALVGALATFGWSKRAKGPPAAVLAWLGQRSMAIYVSHFFFITATRLALEHGLGVTSFAANLPLGFAAGLGGSLALLAVSQRMGIAGLLGFGKLPLTWPAHRSGTKPMAGVTRARNVTQ